MTTSEFEKIISEIRPRLILFARSFIKGNSAATPDDVVQEAVLKIWQHGGFSDIKSPEAFTRKVLKNICLDYLKLKKNNLVEVDSLTNIRSEDNLIQRIEIKESYDIVKTIINQLPENQMLTIRLREIMGYEFEEIAEILNTTEGNIRTLLVRARRGIREKMNIYEKE